VEGIAITCAVTIEQNTATNGVNRRDFQAGVQNSGRA
jgi:hypothetical protein